MQALKRAAGPLVLLLCAAGYLAAVGIAGGSVASMLICAVYAAFCVYAPGAGFVRLCGAKRFGLGQTAAIVFGAALFTLLSIAASVTGVWLVLWLPLLWTAWDMFQHRRELSWKTPRANLILPLVTLLTIAAAVVPQTHAAAAGQIVPNHDFYWNLGNVESFLNGFPPSDLRFSGYTLTYHWLTELFCAGFTMASGGAAYDITAFFVPAVMLLALLAVLFECGALFLGAKQRFVTLFVWLTLFGGCASLWKVIERGYSPFWNLNMRHLLTNINGVATGTLFLAAFSACVWMLWQKTPPRWVYGIGTASFLLLTLAKGPVGGIAAPALAAACVWECGASLYKKQPLQKPLRRAAFAVWILLIFGLVYLWLFSAGAGTSVHFDMDGTLSKSYFANILAALQVRFPAFYPAFLPLFWGLQTLCFAPFGALFALAGGALWLWRRGASSPVWVFAAAGAAGGFLAFYLFDHEAMSQMYFAFAGLFFCNLIGVKALSVLWPRRAVRAVGIAALTVCFATGACTAVWLGMQAVEPGQSPRDLTLSAAEEQAMEVLRREMQRGEQFITNRIHTGAALEGLSNVYSGLSGRQCYMEGFKYAISNLGVTSEEAAARVETAKTLFSAQTGAQAAQALPEGVQVIVYSKHASQSGWDVLEGEPCLAESWADDGVLSLVFENEDVMIFRAA